MLAELAAQDAATELAARDVTGVDPAVEDEAVLMLEADEDPTTLALVADGAIVVTVEPAPRGVAGSGAATEEGVELPWKRVANPPEASSSSEAV